MKKVLFILLAILLSFGVASARDFALTAQWIPNIETDMSYYTLYRTDGTRVAVSACSHVNQPATPLPAHVECDFTVTVAEGTEPVMSFVIVPFDTSGNFGVDSDTATYRADAKPPAKSGGFVIILQ